MRKVLWILPGLLLLLGGLCFVSLPLDFLFSKSQDFQISRARLRVLPSPQLHADSLVQDGLLLRKLSLEADLPALPLIWQKLQGAPAEGTLGELGIGDLQQGPLRIRSLEGTLESRGDSLLGRSLQMQIYGRLCQASVMLVAGEAWSLDFNAAALPLDSLRAQRSAEGRLEGELALQLQGRGRLGVGADDLQLNCRSGPCRLRDWPPLRELAETIGLPSASDYRADSLRLEAHFNGELWQIGTLQLAGREGLLNGKGSWRPHADPDSAWITMDFRWDLSVVELRKADLPRDIRNALDWVADDTGRLELGFHLEGPPARPRASLDSQSLKAPLERGARKLFRKLFGG